MNKPILFGSFIYSQWRQTVSQPEDGQATTEYAMIISFVIILLIVLLYFFGGQVDLTYRDILVKLPF